MPLVTMPDGANVQFPDDMPPEHIKGLIASKFPDIISDSTYSDKRLDNVAGTIDRFQSEAEDNIASDIARPIARAGRTAVAGLAAPFDVANIFLRGGASLAAGLGNAALGTNVSQREIEQTLPMLSQSIKHGIDYLTNNQFQPRNGLERVIDDAGEMVAGAGGSLALANKGANIATNFVNKQIAQQMALQPTTQLISGATGGGASGIAREAGLPPWAQTLIGIIGGGAPAAIRQSPSGIKNLLRGDATQQQIDNNIAAFNQVGANPTVGQATQGNLGRGVESLLAKAPGGISQMRNTALDQQTAIGNKVDDIVGQLSPNASGEAAGRAVSGGIKTTVEAKRLTQKGLYNKLDNYIPQDNPTEASNFLKTLEDINAPIPGAPELSQTLRNPKVGQLSSAARSDTGEIPAKLSQFLDQYGNPMILEAQKGGGKLPYSAMKEVRTRIGEQLEDALVSDIPASQLKRVYGAISRDMEAAAQAKGPEAYNAWKRANYYTRSLHKRLEIVGHVIDQNGGPERVFRAATSGTAEGGTTLRAVMRTLPQENRKLLVATMLRRLGRATPGKQNDIGDAFNTETFLTNWSRLSPQAKTAMTNPMGMRFRKDMDALAKVASNLREGSSIYANPSGTAPVQEALRFYGTLGVAGATGNIGGVALALTGMSSIRGASKLMTNPKVVKWIVEAPKNEKAFRMHVAKLTALAASSPEDSDDIEALQKELSK